MDEKITILRKCYLFKNLSEKELSDIALQANEKFLPKNVIFMEEGKLPNNIYVIISGLVKVFRITEDGKEIILALRSRGDVVGEFELLDEEPQLRSVSIQVLEDAHAMVIPKETFGRLVEKHPSLMVALSRYILKLLRNKNARIEQLVSQTLADRTYEILVTLQKYFSGEITLSHEDIASLVHATRPRVTEALHELAKEGKISLSHKSIRLK